MTESYTPMYDLESLTEPQRQAYLKALCHHLGVPDNLNLVALTRLDDGEGPARLVAYVKRGGAEAIRNNLKLDVKSLTNQMVGGSIVFTAVGIDKSGRQEIAIGSKYIDGLTGSQLDDSVMTASTRALRRLALQFAASGVLDESEVNQRKTVHVQQQVSQWTAPQPTVAPSSEPGKDVTPEPNIPNLKANYVLGEFSIGLGLSKEPILSDAQEQFEKEQAQLRADAIAQLNQEAGVEPTHHEPFLDAGKVRAAISVEAPKKTRKPRGPNKKKVDLGPSEPPKQAEPQPVIAPEPPPQPITAPITLQVSGTALGVPIASVAPSKPRLTPEQVRPFRQRLFHLVNDYFEPAGMVPREGMGNADKLRNLAIMMFPGLQSMNELSVENWEKYLSTLEYKVQNEGPVATVKYIEDSIGL
jgi:hypothetical protein